MSVQRMKGQGNHGNNGDFNSWSGSVSQGGNQHHSRKGYGGYDDYNNYNNSRSGGGSGGYHANNSGGGINDNIRNVERGIHGLGLSSDRGGGANSHGSNAGGGRDQQQKDAPRKMTWASVASQPAKPTVTQTSTILKKKGPGMPPPPMVPGRHNMDIGTWDSPAKNGPPLVPPTFTEPPTPPPVRQNGGADGPAWPTPGQAVNIESTATALAAVAPASHTEQRSTRSTDRDHRDRERQNSYNSYNNDAPLNSSHNNDHNSYHRGGRGDGHGSNHHHHHSQMQPPSHHYHSSSSNYSQHPQQSSYSAPPPQQQQQQQPPSQQSQAAPPAPLEDTTEALNKLLDMSKYNPVNFEIENVHLARFFVIKSYSEDDIHRSIKYNIWCSTEHGNKRLDQAFHEREKEGGGVYLFYSVNGSGHFCGMAQMISNVDYSSNSSVWAQDKWKGSFKVKWIYVKDVPNQPLRHIKLENNENKPVTNSRDTQEVPNAKGQQVWRILHTYKHSTSLFDDFVHYEMRQQEGSNAARRPGPAPPHQYQRGGSPQFDNKYNDRGGRYGSSGNGGEPNNNPRTIPPAGGHTYGRENSGSGYHSEESKYSAGNGSGFTNSRNNYGNSGGFERNNYQGSGGYNRGYSGFRRDDPASGGGRNNSDAPDGAGPTSNYHHRGNGGSYRGNNRGNYNNYNNDYRRPDNRERSDRPYRIQNNAVDYAKE